ncbi:major facilitator superfamily domain-containing protein [Xylariaceae sp. FL1272]|nr:major facilitator superfamily domain-containing protein [Xylariaceae sp. FL1272]
MVPSGRLQDSAIKNTSMNDDITAENEVKGISLILIHLSACLCTFLAGVDLNLIATAIPSITHEFNSTRDIGWYGSAFMLGLAPTQPLAAMLYTLFSQKATYLSFLFVFEVGSLICALSSSSPVLIFGRAIAGVGASGIFAGMFAVITTIIPLHKRAIYIPTVGMTYSVASILGPVLGGALTQSVTWRWCFYINLPIGGAAGIVFLFLVHLKPSTAEKKPAVQRLKNLDFVGFLLFTGSMTMLLLSLQWDGVQYAWSSSVIIWGDTALIPPKPFTKDRNPTLLCAADFLMNVPFQIVIYWLPIWFQGVLNKTPTTSGIDFFPTVIADVLAAFISSGHWIGYQIFGGLGYSIATSLSHVAMQASLPQDLV